MAAVPLEESERVVSNDADNRAGTPVSDSRGGLRVVVTGASGFLGAHLCRRLLAERAEVHAVSRNPHHGNTGDGLHWWQCDATNEVAVSDLIGRLQPDVVFHFGGLVTADPDVNLALPTFHSLLTSVVNILKAVTDVGGGRVILPGSLEEPIGGAENTCVPTSPYAAAKLAAGAYARMFHSLYGTSVVTLRTFMTYGPGQKPTKVIPHTIASLLAGRPPQLSSGDRALDWVYVDDVIDAFIEAASGHGLDGRTLDIGSGTAVRIKDIVDRLTQAIDPSITPLYGAFPDRPDMTIRIADVNTTAVALGWSSSTSLDCGLAKTIEWYRQS